MPRMLEIAFPIILISVLRLHVTHVPLTFFHSQSLLIENIADIPVSYYYDHMYLHVKTTSTVPYVQYVYNS